MELSLQISPVQLICKESIFFQDSPIHDKWAKSLKQKKDVFFFLKKAKSGKTQSLLAELYVTLEIGHVKAFLHNETALSGAQFINVVT